MFEVFSEIELLVRETTMANVRIQDPRAPQYNSPIYRSRQADCVDMVYKGPGPNSVQVGQLRTNT